MTSEQQALRETNNLLQCLILSQLQVYIIDEIQNDNKFWQQEVKFHSSALSKAIVKKHGAHINKLFEVKEGEYVGDVTNIVDELVKKLAKISIQQFGALSEFLDMVIENPAITISEEEKDTLIKSQAVLINELSQKVASARFAAKTLLEKMTEGLKPNDGSVVSEMLSVELGKIVNTLTATK
jgi:hypothetical protein